MIFCELELQKPYIVLKSRGVFLVCRADLSKSTKEIRTLSSEATATSTLRFGVILVWSSLMKEVVGNQGISWNVLFPNESNFGIMCKNCFKAFGSAGCSMKSNTCGKTCIVQPLSIASLQNSNTSFPTAIEQSAQMHQAKFLPFKLKLYLPRTNSLIIFICLSLKWS